MNTKYSRSPSREPASLDLITAVKTFVAKGGVIAVIADGETAASVTSSTDASAATDLSLEYTAKVELLKSLAAKGAGFNALQYSLRMNRKDIRQLASENGVKISFSQPVRDLRRETRHDPVDDVDDVIAGHAMHYSSLGYTVSEIAQVLDLSLRQVWDIGKAYRIEFRHKRDSDTP